MRIILPVIIVVAFIFLLIYGLLSRRKREKAMADLASQRGWTALPHDAASLSPYLPTYIQMMGQQNYGFMNGYTRSNSTYDMAYQSTSANHNLIFFQYEYTEYHRNIDPGRPDQAYPHYFTVIYVTMPTVLPFIILLHHAFLSKLTNVQLHPGLQKIGLEGNFNDSYDTYIVPDSQVAALSLLTPDVMELVMALAGSSTHTSVQCNGQSLTISFENQLLTPQFIEPALRQLEPLLQKIDNKPNVGLAT